MNKIETIGSNAFNHLPHLEQVWVDHNPLGVIKDAGLAFATTGHILVYLNNNNLTSKGLSGKSIVSPTKGSISIDFESNLFTDFPESIFSTAAHNANTHLYVYNNPFTCDCSMKWLLNSSSGKANVHGLYCKKQQKEIFDLREQDLEACDVNATNVHF